MNPNVNSHRYVISDTPSDEDMKIVQKGLEDHNRKFPSGGLDIPKPDISLVMKDISGKIIGGVITSMLTGVMHLEVLWVDETYRNRGLGKSLVLQAERIAKEKGYPASHTWTFSFQAPEFYQSIGYEVLGIFDGYTGGITEYVLHKKFESAEQTPYEANGSYYDEFTISEDTSKESMKILHEGLRRYVTKHIGKLRKKNPEIKIKFVIKNEEDQVIGGVQAYTLLKVVHIEQLWVDEKYRNQGYGKELLTTTERIATENGCISGLVMALSFQSPEFFQKFGYEIFGVSDGYPDSIKDYYLIKRFKTY
ncbi:MAG: GNAT family N-acetyltransferase [Candidatus Hodarchaeota archaeon]